MIKQQIRQNVFETNSSSTHSISIAPNQTNLMVLDTIIPDENGVIELKGGEFGWEWDRMNDALTKANYCAVDQQGRKERMDMLKEVLMEQTGATDVIFTFSNDYDKNWSYIDHDSCGTSNEVFHDKESLRHFIFNMNCWLFTGNDNSTASPDFYTVPTHTTEGIVEPQFRFELRVDGMKETVKYFQQPSREDIENGLESLFNHAYLMDDGTFDTDMSIGAQMNRDNPFEFNTWLKPVEINEGDKTYGFANFIKDPWAEARKIYERDFIHLDWQGGGYEKCEEIKKELINKENSPYIRKVKFSIEKI